MKKLFLFSYAVFIAMILFSCSETTEPSDDPNVKVIAQMTSNLVDVNAIRAKRPDIQASTIDSIVIKDFRILLSRLKFQSKTGDNDPNYDDHEMKAGPFLMNLDSTGKAFTLANGTIPEGTYSKIKFELHRFSTDEAETYVNDAIYGDFATIYRYSFIIKGIIYENASAEEFTFNGTVTANLMLDFEPEITFEEGENYTIALDIDPNLAFISGNSLLDPRVQKDANDIENNLKDIFKSVKKK
ncbi:MAG: DUF4382 domain-containing protein [bacterium]